MEKSIFEKMKWNKDADASDSGDIDTVWKLVSDYLPVCTVLPLRLICNQVNKSLMSHAPLISRIIFTVKDDKSFVILSENTGNIDWLRGLRLKNILHSQRLFDDSCNFLVLREHGKRLESLYLEDCEIRLGRLVELLPFCVNLKELQIKNCPEIYRTSSDILAWGEFIRPFCHRIYHLGKISLDEKSSGVLNRDKALLGFLHSARNITSLNLHLEVKEASKVPSKEIAAIIKNNRYTLRDLELGCFQAHEFEYPSIEYDEDGKELESIWVQLSHPETVPQGLQTLKIVSQGITRLPIFLSSLYNLRSLYLETTVADSLTSVFDATPNLKELVLESCHLVAGDISVALPKLKGLESVHLIYNKIEEDTTDQHRAMGILPNAEDTDMTKEYVTTFQKPTESPLKDISLEMRKEHDGPIGPLVAAIVNNRSYQKSLKSLTIKDGIGFTEPIVRLLGQLKDTLEELNLSGSVVEDSAILGIDGNNNLACLQKLRSLNLSLTRVSDDIILPSIVRLPHIHFLDLRSTRMSPKSVLELLEISEKVIPELKLGEFNHDDNEEGLETSEEEDTVEDTEDMEVSSTMDVLNDDDYMEENDIDLDGDVENKSADKLSNDAECGQLDWDLVFSSDSSPSMDE